MSPQYVPGVLRSLPIGLNTTVSLLETLTLGASPDPTRNPEESLELPAEPTGHTADTTAARSGPGPWGLEEDVQLLLAVARHGHEPFKWKKIESDPDFSSLR